MVRPFNTIGHVIVWTPAAGTMAWAPAAVVEAVVYTAGSLGRGLLLQCVPQFMTCSQMRFGRYHRCWQHPIVLKHQRSYAFHRSA